MLGLLVSGVLVAAAIVVYFRQVEKHTLFHPQKQIEFAPEEFGLAYEDIFFKTSDNVQINGWLLPASGARFTILFSHGNAGNIGHRLEKIKFFHDLGCNVFIFDFRGYGRSNGNPSESGLYRDTQAAYDYLLSRGIRPEDIVGYGESIGGAFIIDLAAKQKLAALIIDSSFTSARDMAKNTFPALPHWIFASRLDSEEKIKTIICPKLIAHSINDDIVPYALGRKLYESAKPPKEFLQIRGGHNSNFFESEALLREKIADFLKRL